MGSLCLCSLIEQGSEHLPLLSLHRVPMFLRVCLLLAALVAASEALRCYTCTGNCIATPGGKYNSEECDAGVNFCSLLISEGKPSEMGCDNSLRTSFPAEYTQKIDSHKRCHEGQGTTNGRPGSGQLYCLCNTDNCNDNQHAAAGAQQVSGSLIFAGVIGLLMARI